MVIERNGARTVPASPATSFLPDARDLADDRARRSRYEDSGEAEEADFDEHRRSVESRCRMSSSGAGHDVTRNRSASARLRSRPIPGRERSGCSIPPTGSTAPSNSTRSRRAWSWKYSR